MLKFFLAMMNNLSKIVKRIGVVYFILFSVSLFGQVPQGFNYQAVLRDSDGALKTNEKIALKLFIINGSADGDVVFQENHSVTTNGQGLVSVVVGSTNPSGFTSIDWSKGVYYLRVSVDGVEMGTTQLLSVPYALYAETSGNGVGPQGEPGKSAYELWLESNEGKTLDEFLESMVGPQGQMGKSVYEIWKETYSPDGTIDQFMDSLKGNDGLDGKSAYEIWKEAYSPDGTIDQFIDSLKGKDGVAGSDGKSAFEIWKETYSPDGTIDQFIDSLKGKDGVAGAEGKSAYEIWKETYSENGTVDDFFDSLTGPQGEPGVSADESINDTVVSADSLWSSKKINEKLNAKLDTASLQELETDPVFSASLASKITAEDTARWSAGSGMSSDDYATKAYVIDLFLKMFDADKLLGVGFSEAELYAAGHGAFEIYKAGGSVSSLIDLIKDPKELQKEGVGIKTLKSKGVTDEQLVDAGFKGTLNDSEGNEYQWVKIGDQVWMAENLRATQYADGSPIEFVAQADWGANVYGDVAYGYTFDSVELARIAGNLYTWPAASRESSVTIDDHSQKQGVCPDGWHLPTTTEWYNLSQFLDTTGGYLPGPDIAVDSVWKTSLLDSVVGFNVSANNELGFSALPMGFRYSGGGDAKFYEETDWWCSDGKDANAAFYVSLKFGSKNLSFSAPAVGIDTRQGFRVRCIKD